MNNQATMIENTKSWLKTIVVGLNFCPFAGYEMKKGSIRFHVADGVNFEQLLLDLTDELRYLDENSGAATTLIIYSDENILKNFGDYLDFVYLGNELLKSNGYEGVYQLASFHPNYCFEGEAINSASNYTNRSPYPILHLLREESIENALGIVQDASKIPERNIEFANELGVEALKKRLARCLK